MADSSAPTPEPAPAARAPNRPTLLELLRAFTQVSLSGFGGALPWSRRMIVERKRWMSNEEFNETFALSQFLLGPPLAIVTVLAVLYERYGDIATLGHILAGIAAAAAGLLIAVIAKMAAPMFTKRWNSGPLIAILAFVGVAIMGWPLPYVFLGLAPFSIALAWFRK
jgi:chromate transporter